MDKSKFLSLLNENHSWPSVYVFKFIVKVEQKSELLALLLEHKISEKGSKKGNYISITSEKMVNSAEEVLKIYENVGHIKGVMTL